MESVRAALAVLLCAFLSSTGRGAGPWVPNPGAGPGPAGWAGDLSPLGKSEWSYARAGHLLERAGFGGTPEEIARLAAMTPQQAVDSLVEFSRIPNELPPFQESGIFNGFIEEKDKHILRSGQGEGIPHR